MDSARGQRAPPRRRAGLTIEVVQQRFLEHRAHEYVYLIHLKQQSQGDGEPQAHPAKGQERQIVRHTNNQIDRQAG